MLVYKFFLITYRMPSVNTTQGWQIRTSEYWQNFVLMYVPVCISLIVLCTWLLLNPKWIWKINNWAKSQELSLLNLKIMLFFSDNVLLQLYEDPSKVWHWRLKTLVIWYKMVWDKESEVILWHLCLTCHFIFVDFVKFRENTVFWRDSTKDDKTCS